LPGEVVVFTTRPREDPRAVALAAAGARMETVPGGERCDLAAVIERLAALEVNDVWVEAGPELNGALLVAGLIDELIVYVAPRLFGDTARGMFGVPALASLADAWSVTFEDVVRVGEDLRITARVGSVAGP
jgi:diaminohydroxyphosphoribosylaminopyrimidine deaminase/5-amino-6-(5-phosphoribosylamino)uracil reductase